MIDFMEIAKTIAPKQDDDYFLVCDYQKIIDSFGVVAVQVDSDDYQGDTRVLYSDCGSGFGYLEFGWGSCSGCDALQACNNLQDLSALISELSGSIKWLPREEMLKFFQEKDWDGSYWREDDDMKQFVSQCVRYLTPEAS